MNTSTVDRCYRNDNIFYFFILPFHTLKLKDKYKCTNILIIIIYISNCKKGSKYIKFI